MKYLKKYTIFAEGKAEKVKIVEKTIDGFTILIGKNAEANEHLTHELAKDEDYWLHAKGVPGSHVVIRVGERVPDDRVKKEAAKIAAENSSAKKLGQSSIDVICCKKKSVKKALDSPAAGKVIVDYNLIDLINVELSQPINKKL